ncbi:MAG: hydantoinase/oxoprolinase family protein [Armatimonadetes bacterium]|nr:hydantoinase/oxoprolinase family protein [Anaerolineae bacterium]
MLAGVDIGGTFTDLVISENGSLRIYKRLSTPHDPAEALLAGLNEVTGGTLSMLERVSHGSTVATNAILARTGARAALIATQGFRDVLHIARQNRPDLYALHPTLPPPLIPRERCYDLPERLDYTGAVLTPLDLTALDTILDQISVQAVESVAVCLMYSFLNPAHEHAVRDRIRERGYDWQVALSSDVLPQFREYERASATALEAYVRPVMARYIAGVQAALPCPLRVMKSDGGVMDARTVGSQAIQTALSGPAAGVIGAHYLAAVAGYDQLITLDMGGTSTDVALIPGELVRRPESTIDGLPLRIRLLDIETVGAGGGSLARLDAGGALRVGPASAGAVPGPICYGRGGTQVTVSDAHAVLGRLDAAGLLGGQMPLDITAAQTALAALGAQLGFEGADAAQRAALGVLTVADATIERAVRRVSVERGYDPRNFTLMAFGGAGGLHACAVAERLSIQRILIPRYPGVLCAFGLLVADVTREDTKAILAPLTSATWANIRRIAGQMRTRIVLEYIDDARKTPPVEFNTLVDVRYQGQAYELTIPRLPASHHDALQAFHDAHERTYGFSFPTRSVEVVNVRVQSIIHVARPALKPEPLVEATLTGDRFERDALHPGASFVGAALITQPDSSTLVAAGWQAKMDAWRNLVLTRFNKAQNEDTQDDD